MSAGPTAEGTRATPRTLPLPTAGPPGRSLVVAGIPFQNPVLLASGTAGFGRELDGVCDLEALGGLVTKAVSLQPRPGHPPPRVAEVPGGMLNAVGLANPGVDQVRERDLPWLAGRLRRARVLVNVVGFEEEEYAQVIERLDDPPIVAAYELNLSCPNTARGGLEFGADPAAVARIIAGCRAVTRRPLFAKLSPALADPAAMALTARDAGADGVTLVNTLPVHLHPGAGAGARARLGVGAGGGGVSGPALLPMGLLAVRLVRARMAEFPVIGVGGIRSAADARQYLAAGAALVAIGTAGLADPRCPERIARELERTPWPS